MASWNVQRSGIHFILRKDGETVGKIQAISASKTIGSVNIKLAEDKELITSTLINYRPEQNDQFIACLSSRTRFVEKWNEISKDSMGEKQVVTSSPSTEEKTAAVQLESKLAYSYVLVHIMNMKEPVQERKFRDVDQKHVSDLKAKIIQNPDLKCRIMLGNVKENKQCLTEDLLKTPGKVDVEVIGGNHTRTAIMQILNDPQFKYDTRYHLWPMKVYCQLDRIQAQKLGFDHNTENDSVRPTSAFDILHFARKELLAITNGLVVCTAPQIKEWKGNIIHVLNLTKNDLHNKYKTLVSLAKSPTPVWEKLVLFEEKWRKKLIIGQTPGDLKTGHLKPIALLQERDQEKLLDNLIQQKITFREFKKVCSQRRDKQNCKDTETPEDQPADAQSDEEQTAVDQPTGDHTTTPIQPEGCDVNENKSERHKDLKKKLDSALATIRLLTEEGEILKCKLADSENKKRKTEEHLIRVQTENLELLHELKQLKSQKKGLEDDVEHHLSKDKVANWLPSSSSKRKDRDTEDDQLNVLHSKKKIMSEAEKCPEPRKPVTDDQEPEEKILFVEYTRRRGFIGVLNTSAKTIRYCKTTVCQSIGIPKLKFSPNSFALEEKAYSLDESYIIAHVPTSVMTVRGNELMIVKDADVLKEFLMKSISAYLDA